MQRILLLFFIVVVSFKQAFSQNVKFVKADYSVRHGNLHYYFYTVKKRQYSTAKWGAGSNYNRTLYFIGYEETNPSMGRIYFNKPVLRRNNIDSAFGTVFFLNKSYCDYQFERIKNGKKQVVLARQAITKDDKNAYNISIGKVYRVYFDTGNLNDESFISWTNSLNDTLINFRTPFLSKPNGNEFGIELKSVYLNNKILNNFLTENHQSKLEDNFVISGYWNYYSKLDFWFGFGMGGGNHFFTGNIGVGYLQKLNRKFYLNTGIHLSGYDYTLSSFKVDELKNFNSSSQFVYTSWCLNPRLELMCRKLSNNVWGTQFLKLGIGAYIDLSNSKWKYEIGQDAVDNKGNHYTKYVFSQNLNSMPTFSKCIFYLSLSYSLFAFEKQ